MLSSKLSKGSQGSKKSMLHKVGLKIMSGLVFSAVGGAPVAAQSGECMKQYAEGDAILYKGQCYRIAESPDACDRDPAARVFEDRCYVPDQLNAPSTSESDPAGPGISTRSLSRPALKLGGRNSDDLHIYSRIGMEVAAFLQDELRSSGGNEKKWGQSILTFDVELQKDVDGSALKNVFIKFSLINPNAAMNWDMKDKRNFNNESQLRGDGSVMRPIFTGSVGGNFEVGESQRFEVQGGVIEASGIAPLKGIPTQHHTFAPYGLVILYDAGLRVDYSVLKDRIDEIVHASFSIVEGDGRLGQTSVVPDTSDANSYPSVATGIEVNTVKLFSRVFGLGENWGKRAELYVGNQFYRGSSGSYPGAKVTIDTATSYVGTRIKPGKEIEYEVRGYMASHTRNQQGDYNGRHGVQVESESVGGELSAHNIRIGKYTFTAYGNKYNFRNKTGVPDGVFTVGEVTQVKGWTLGLQLNNFMGVQGLDLTAAIGSRRPNNPGSANLGTWRRSVLGEGDWGRQGYLGVKYNLDILK